MDDSERLDDLHVAMKKHNKDAAELAEQYCNVYGYRKVLHLAFAQHEIAISYLVEHPAIILDKEAYSYARTAAEALFDLYQRIGQLESYKEEDTGNG